MKPWIGVLAGVLINGQTLPQSALLEDVSARTGLNAALFHAPTPQKHLIETMAGGVALLDFDGDGRLDIFLANGAPQPQLQKSGPPFWNRLYRNIGDFRFEDVTEKAGVQGQGYSIGAATGDFNNDGHVDLFVAGVNRNLLYRNRGNGMFEEVAAATGLLPSSGKQPWAVAAAFADYDADGWLDLFVVNYVVWDPVAEPFCGDTIAKKYRTYCHPSNYAPLPNKLFRNKGNGTFEDVSEASGIGAHKGKGMGVAAADYDRDGKVDFFVTNDTTPNFLFRNLGGGKFAEVAMKSGVGLNDDGKALSSMGVDFRDLDNDGLPDLFITALANETFPYYRNLGQGLFEDLTYPTRIGAATLPYSGWGAAMVDLDQDGWKDLVAAAGDVQDNTEVYSSRHSKLPVLLLLSTKQAKAFNASIVGSVAQYRGLACGDLDNDGWPDLVVTKLGQAPLVLRNRAIVGNHWLGVRVTSKGGRDALGAEVRLISQSGLVQHNQISPSTGYASAGTAVAHFGIGKETAVREVEVRWPDGKIRKVENPKIDAYLTVAEP